MAKIKALPGAALGFLRGLAAKLGPLCAGLWQKLRRLPQGLPQNPEGGKRRFLLAGLGAFAVLLLALVVLLMAGGGRDRPGSGDGSAARPRGEAGIKERPPELPRAVPPEEFFLPPEPDFIPGVLPERERRESWTLEDAEPYWQDPLKKGEESWRDRIEAEIDDLMERVP
ncbi:MAG: hypothetical protein LBP27_07180 [Treponema sp.]|nr:hypothetical protein [Treponema sp.]